VKLLIDRVTVAKIDVEAQYAGVDRASMIRMLLEAAVEDAPERD